jgi:chromosomal replication initiator protein
MDNFWQQVLKTIKGQITANSFETWIKPIHCRSIEEKNLVLEVPNNFFRDWISEHYLHTIEGALYQLTGEEFSVSLQVKKGKPPHLREVPAPGEGGEDEALASRMFNPRYTFENFVIGAGNQFAHAASQAVADTPGRRYNPLFVYGGVGLGKTHLLNAVGHRIIKNRTFTDPANKVCYISSEEFTNELVNSIRFERMDGFRKKFRNIEVLLIDDIQFISGKERTQIEFFHTFNSLYENKKQIVITSDQLPREISDFEERLKSRFEWGLIADIQPPDVETKVAILKKKAALENIHIPNEVAFYVASHINSNIRILEGCLIRLGAFASLTKQEINLDMAKEALRNFIRDRETIVTIESIQKKVSSYFNLKPKDLRSRRRLKQLVIPRQIGMYLARKLTNSSLIEIGEKFGGKDHSTVIHSLKRVEEKCIQDQYTKNVVGDLIKAITE